MYYTGCFSKYLERDDLLAIELQDTPENILERLVFSDENDQVYKDDEYKDAHRAYYLKEIKKDITYQKKPFSRIANKFQMNNETPEEVVRHLMEQLMSMGRYDSYVDAMFEYRENEKAFCRADFDAADTLRHWAMFTERPKNGGTDKKESGKISHKTQREWDKPAGKVRIGRNDPCPCGSGKEYKFCCLNKHADAMDLIESREERSKWLKSYPYIGQERIEGRI